MRRWGCDGQLVLVVFEGAFDGEGGLAFAFEIFGEVFLLRTRLVWGWLGVGRGKGGRMYIEVMRQGVVNGFIGMRGFSCW